MKNNQQIGRKPKKDKCRYRYTFNLNDEQNAKFLTICEQNQVADKANFIKQLIFENQIKVVKIDKTAFDFYVKLTEFFAQFRAVGINYNQITKAVKTAFSEKKALAFLYKTEKATLEMVKIQQEIIDLTADFEQKYLTLN
ncbi:MAG: hypothetical protein LBN95_03395 [Prevotellaceae bacterium]|nr:hypothetical protein [Prevotellaceae bacterium]